MPSRRTRCRTCGDQLEPRYDRGRSRCICCRAVQSLAAWRRRAQARTNILTLLDLRDEAAREALGDRKRPERDDQQRAVAVVYERKLREAGIISTGVNEPPPGWSTEEDRREEWIALSEHLAMRAP